MASTSISRTQTLLQRGCRLRYARFITSTSHSTGGSRLRRTCLALLAGGLATFGAVVYALDRSVVEASTLVAHAPHHKWGFERLLGSFDHAAIRRGWQVYKEVCSSCHSIKYVTFKDLIDVCYSEQEVRDIAAEYEVEDGPNDTGEYFTRPCKVHDSVPSPFPNEEAARAANNGALPVDLSYVLEARHNGRNYLFAFLTSFMEPPAGMELMDGQSFNPYFEGGAMGMSDILQSGMIEYDDGTPAYKSQMAKDVVEFLMWTSNMEWDTRKSYITKTVGITIILFASIYPIYRAKIATHKKALICFVWKQNGWKNR